MQRVFAFVKRREDKIRAVDWVTRWHDAERRRPTPRRSRVTDGLRSLAHEIRFAGTLSLFVRVRASGKRASEPNTARIVAERDRGELIELAANVRNRPSLAGHPSPPWALPTDASAKPGPDCRADEGTSPLTQRRPAPIRVQASTPPTGTSRRFPGHEG